MSIFAQSGTAIADSLSFVVWRDQRLAAGFVKKSHAIEYAQGRSYHDESAFTVHDSDGVVIATFRDGEPEGEPS